MEKRSPALVPSRVTAVRLSGFPGVLWFLSMSVSLFQAHSGLPLRTHGLRPLYSLSHLSRCSFHDKTSKEGPLTPLPGPCARSAHPCPVPGGGFRLSAGFCSYYLSCSWDTSTQPARLSCPQGPGSLAGNTCHRLESQALTTVWPEHLRRVWCKGAGKRGTV